MDPEEFLFIKKSSEIIFDSNGKHKKISKIEKKTARFAFSSIVSIKNIKKNEKLSKKNIWVKRPGTGDFLANKFKYIIGKHAKREILEGKFIKKNDIK